MFISLCIISKNKKFRKKYSLAISKKRRDGFVATIIIFSSITSEIAHLSEFVDFHTELRNLHSFQSIQNAP